MGKYEDVDGIEGPHDRALKRYPGERKCVCRDCAVGVVNNAKVPKCWTCANACCAPSGPCRAGRKP